MLVWKSVSGGVPVVPDCLQGWEPRAGAQLVHRETTSGHVVGVGDPLIWTEPAARAWADVGDGWQVALVPGTVFEPRLLTRVQGWADVGEVQDTHRRAWHAPKIRRPGGGRAFRCAYGRDWLPALTAEQIRAEEIVAAALEAANQDTPMAVACQWAAELLTMATHISVPAISALALMDETLACGTLALSASLEIEGGASHGV